MYTPPKEPPVTMQLKKDIVVSVMTGAYNEKKTRREEHDTTTHLIKFQVFTHGSRVTKFSARSSK